MKHCLDRFELEPLPHHFSTESDIFLSLGVQNAIKQSWQALERARADNKPVPPEAFSNEVKVRHRTVLLLYIVGLIPSL